MELIITAIIEELELDDSKITNIYNYGSWVYGTNHEKSDRDFLIIIDCKNGERSRPLKFRRDFDYFHSFELHRLGQYDVTIHSCENFERLLEKNYMLAVECLFYPDEFILRNKIDYKIVYLSKYYNPFRIKQVIFYEYRYSVEQFIERFENDSISYLKNVPDKPTVNQFLCDAVHVTTREEDRVLKYVFHGIRYLDVGEQLIRTQSIHDFKRASHVLAEIKDVYISQDKNITSVLDYLDQKSFQYSEILNELLPTNDIEGTFKIFLTIDDYSEEQFLDLCQINNWKSVCIEDRCHSKSKASVAVFDYVGKNPTIVQHIRNLVQLTLQESNIGRVKIGCSAALEGVPRTNIDKILFWDEKSSYFECIFKIHVDSNAELNRLKDFLRHRELLLTHLTSFDSLTNDSFYQVILRLSQVGSQTAFVRKNEIDNCLKRNQFLPLSIEENFIVYDSNMDIDKIQTPETYYLPSDTSNKINIPAKYRIGFKNRKFFSRSSS